MHRLVCALALVLAACHPTGDGNALDITLTLDASVSADDASRIATLDLDVTGSEPFSKHGIPVDGQLEQNRIAGLRYKPGSTSGTVQMHLTANAGDGTEIASGEIASITLGTGTQHLTLTLYGSGGGPDLGINGGSDGAVDLACDDACGGVTPPRPIAPLSTSFVTSRRPKLSWLLAADSDGAHVDLCKDRACTNIIGGGDATSSFVPTADLPVGVVFWRLWGKKGTAMSAGTSPVWQFTIGARSATVSTAYSTTVDVNGDGFADLVVGADSDTTNAGKVYVYLGGTGGLGTTSTPKTTIAPPAAGMFGHSVASAGDVNGDGFGDIVVGAYATAGSVGAAYVYLGGPNGLGSAPMPAISLTGPDGSNAKFGVSVAGVGDLNGDGYGDVVVGASGATGGAGRVHVYFGGPSGLSMQPAIDGPDAGGFGAAVAAAGDTNGDGFADVIVGAPAQNTNQPGHAYIYYGSATGLGATPTSIVGPDDAVIPDGYNGEFGLAVTCAGDVNGDGYSDVLVGAENANQSTGRAYVFHGGGSGVSKTAASVMTGHGLNSRGTFGSAVASAGDVNGDGYSDIIVGGYCDVETVDTNGFTLCGNGEASLYLGSSSGLGGTPSAATVFVGPSAVSHLGVAVAGGDVNGDGFCDVLFSDAPNGTIWGFLGGSSGIANGSLGLAASTIADPGTGVTNFGISLH